MLTVLRAHLDAVRSDIRCGCSPCPAWVICPAGLWLAVQEEHVLQRIVLGARAAAVKVTSSATCGLARSVARLVTAGGLLGGALMTKSIALSYLHPDCLLSFRSHLDAVRSDIRCGCSPSPARVICQLVFGWPSRRNMYCNGSFSVSDAAAVNVTAAPATCGLARSVARLVTQEDYLAVRLIDEIDRLGAVSIRVMFTVLCSHLDAVRSDVRCGCSPCPAWVICPAGLWLAVHDEHVLQRIALGVRCGCGKSYCRSCHLRAGQVGGQIGYSRRIIWRCADDEIDRL